MTGATNLWTEPSSLERALKADHEQLEHMFERLMANIRCGDSEQLRVRWLELDRTLEHHLRLEEDFILPTFERACAEHAARVRREHHEIRARLVQLGVDLDLHSLCPDSARRFIESLRQHAAFEEHVFYPWSRRHLPQTEQATLVERLVATWHRMEPGSDQARSRRGREWT